MGELVRYHESEKTKKLFFYKTQVTAKFDRNGVRKIIICNVFEIGCKTVS